MFGGSGAGYVCMGKVCERERERRGDEGCSVCKKLGGWGGGGGHVFACMTVFSNSNKLYVPVRYMTSCVSHAVYFGQLHNAQSQGSVFFPYAQLQYSVLECREGTTLLQQVSKSTIS